jgi:aspartyl-tRNA synthetase
MSFVEQEDVFNVVEKLMVNTFKEFSKKKLLFDKFPKDYIQRSNVKIWI